MDTFGSRGVAGYETAARARLSHNGVLSAIREDKSNISNSPNDGREGEHQVGSLKARYGIPDGMGLLILSLSAGGSIAHFLHRPSKG